MRKFGLVGKNISYSFSEGFFSEKFNEENIDASYRNFDLDSITDLKEVLEKNPEVEGLNVTIPYKEAILPFLDDIDPDAENIKAVNTIKVSEGGRLKGYNTDFIGFAESLKPHLQEHHKKALILGTGGASKAINYALDKMGIEAAFVSRTADEHMYSYEELDELVLREYQLIINCTPIGTYPNVSDCPDVPIGAINSQHLVFDLIYNPPVTRLMELSKVRGATVLNGLKMLEIQADEAWKIWNMK